MKKNTLILVVFLALLSCNKDSFIQGYGTNSYPMENSNQTPGSFSATINGVNPGPWKINNIIYGAGCTITAIAADGTTIIQEYPFPYAVVGNDSLDQVTVGYLSVQIPATGGYIYYNTLNSPFNSPCLIDEVLNITSINQNSQTVSGNFIATCYANGGSSSVYVSGVLKDAIWSPNTISSNPNFSISLTGYGVGVTSTISANEDTISANVDGFQISLCTFFPTDVVGTYNLYSLNSANAVTLNDYSILWVYSTYGYPGGSNTSNGTLNITSINQSTKTVSGNFTGYAYSSSNSDLYPINFSGSFTNVIW